MVYRLSAQWIAHRIGIREYGSLVPRCASIGPVGGIGREAEMSMCLERGRTDENGADARFDGTRRPAEGQGEIEPSFIRLERLWRRAWQR
jgi:hypothetical protein